MLFFAVHISYIPPRANRLVLLRFGFAAAPSRVTKRHENAFCPSRNVPSNLYLKALSSIVHTPDGTVPTSLRRRRARYSRRRAKRSKNEKLFARAKKSVGGPASRRPTLRTPPPFVSASPPRAHFLSSRCRVCLRRYGLYFMSSRRSEVLRRFCGANERERIES